MIMYKYGAFRFAFVAYVSLIVIALSIYVGIMRNNSVNRDGTYWNKLDFPNDGKLTSSIPPDAIAMIAGQQQAECATGGTGPRGPTGSRAPTSTRGPTGSTSPKTPTTPTTPTNSKSSTTFTDFMNSMGLSNLMNMSYEDRLKSYNWTTNTGGKGWYGNTGAMGPTGPSEYSSYGQMYNREYGYVPHT